MISRHNAWTDERRAAQSKAIKEWRPWTKSTGPKTLEGKARSAKNGRYPSLIPRLRDLARILRQQLVFVNGAL